MCCVVLHPYWSLKLTAGNASVHLPFYFPDLSCNIAIKSRVLSVFIFKVKNYRQFNLGEATEFSVKVEKSQHTSVKITIFQKGRVTHLQQGNLKE